LTSNLLNLEKIKKFVMNLAPMPKNEKFTVFFFWQERVLNFLK